jgi:DNA-binding transcriptional regulator YdaS (Cro superfamily)
MAALRGISPAIRTVSLTSYSTFLKRAAHLGAHKRAAELLGISPATESEWSTENMERACQFAAAYGLELVPKGTTLPPDQQRAVMTIAAASIERMAIEMQAQDSQPADLDPPA